MKEPKCRLCGQRHSMSAGCSNSAAVVAEQIQLDDSVEATATELLISTNATRDDLVRIGQALMRVETGMQWWIGDWWNEVERKHGDGKAICAEAGINYQTARQCGWVSRQMFLRKNNLSFGHHNIVAALEPDLQRSWLDTAEAEGWSIAKLADTIKNHRGLPPDEEPEALPAISEVVREKVDAGVDPVEAIQEATNEQGGLPSPAA